MKYRKIPIEIDAIQYNGENHEDIVEFTGASSATVKSTYINITMPTFEFTVKQTDYVVRDKHDVVYVMPSSIFEGTYEIVQDNFAEEEIS